MMPSTAQHSTAQHSTAQPHSDQIKQSEAEAKRRKPKQIKENRSKTRIKRQEEGRVCVSVCAREQGSAVLAVGGGRESLSNTPSVARVNASDSSLDTHTHIGSWYSDTCNSTDARNSYRARPHTTRPVHSDNGQRERGHVVVEWKHQQAFDSDGMTMYTAQHVNEHHDAQTDAHRQTTPQQQQLHKKTCDKGNMHDHCSSCSSREETRRKCSTCGRMESPDNGC
jgi:hypothetical protein